MRMQIPAPPSPESVLPLPNDWDKKDYETIDQYVEKYLKLGASTDPADWKDAEDEAVFLRGAAGKSRDAPIVRVPSLRSAFVLISMVKRYVQDAEKYMGKGDGLLYEFCQVAIKQISAGKDVSFVEMAKAFLESKKARSEKLLKYCKESDDASEKSTLFLPMLQRVPGFVQLVGAWNAILDKQDKDGTIKEQLYDLLRKYCLSVAKEFDSLEKANTSFLGSSDLHWTAFYFCGEEIANKYGVKYDTKDREMLEHFHNYALSAGPLFFFETCTIICDRPEEIKGLLERKRLHCENGPALRFRDGFCIYVVDGVLLNPMEKGRVMIETEPEQMDEAWLRKYFLGEENASIRAVILKKIPSAMLCRRLDAKVIHEEPNSPYKYKLLELKNPDGSPMRYLEMLNPTIGCVHIEDVHPDCKTVQDAIDFRMPDDLRKIPVDDKNGEDWQQQGDVCIWNRKAKSRKSRPVSIQ